LGLTVS
jgi:hypothetical protein